MSSDNSSETVEAVSEYTQAQSNCKACMGPCGCCEELHVYIIDDCGERVWVVAGSTIHAWQLYTEEYAIDPEDLSATTQISMMPDEQMLKITDDDNPEGQEKLAKEWATPSNLGVIAASFE